MPGPYPYDISRPNGAVDGIQDGDDELRTWKSTIKTALNDGPLAGFPTDAKCTAGWPRILTVATKALLPPREEPGGRLVYVTDTDHLYLERVGPLGAWVNAYPAGEWVILPALGLTGDGFLASPNLCGDQVLDYFQKPTYRGLFVGPDFPCGVSAAYRAFLRFPIAGKPIKELVSVKFLAFLIETGARSSNCNINRCADFGTLDFGDFTLPALDTIGTFATPSTQVGWVQFDVTAAYIAQVEAAATHIAFRLATVTEEVTTQSRWYAFVAADDPINLGFRPHLRLTFLP